MSGPAHELGGAGGEDEPGDALVIARLPASRTDLVSGLGIDPEAAVVWADLHRR